MENYSKHLKTIITDDFSPSRMLPFVFLYSVLLKGFIVYQGIISFFILCISPDLSTIEKTTLISLSFFLGTLVISIYILNEINCIKNKDIIYLKKFLIYKIFTKRNLTLENLNLTNFIVYLSNKTTKKEIITLVDYFLSKNEKHTNFAYEDLMAYINNFEKLNHN